MYLDEIYRDLSNVNVKKFDVRFKFDSFRFRVRRVIDLTDYLIVKSHTDTVGKKRIPISFGAKKLDSFFADVILRPSQGTWALLSCEKELNIINEIKEDELVRIFRKSYLRKV